MSGAQQLRELEAVRSRAQRAEAELEKERALFIKRKVYPKEGTRVRIPGMYHITTWYGAVGH